MSQKLSLFLCPVCDMDKETSEGRLLDSLMPQVQALVCEAHPNIKGSDLLCNPCASQISLEYIHSELEKDKGELSVENEELLRTIEEQGLLSPSIQAKGFRATAFREHLADKIASFGGSWAFIIIFMTVLIGWMVVNTIFLVAKPLDPFPFVLLNLMLSCVAALQAPVILMSQNRGEEKDRVRGQNDYQVNLRAELEIRYLSRRVDQILREQKKLISEFQRIADRRSNASLKSGGAHES